MDAAPLDKALRNNLDWFENSGVMRPPDGAWGVAERIVLARNNASLEKIYSHFPFYVQRNGYSILEHRRADCCFQTAWLYLLAEDVLEQNRYGSVAENMLEYLFCRSGLRNTYRDNLPRGIWQWSMPQVAPTYWLDDNSWSATVCFEIAERSPELARKFPLVQAGEQTTKAMLDSLDTILLAGGFDDASQLPWMGNVASPHWGALVCMSFAWAYKSSDARAYISGMDRVIDRMSERRHAFSASEHAYAAFGLACAGALADHRLALDAAITSGESLLESMSPLGHFPSQWDSEAPVGDHLVDLVYTQNWATLAMWKLSALTGRSDFRSSFEKSLELLVNIQDASPERHLHGCWRGLFDIESKQWEGGDRFEGGANSIYTGWTNAPISIAIALELQACKRNENQRSK